MSTLHAHVESESADCDGRYSRTYIMDADQPKEGQSSELTSDFAERVLVSIVSLGTERGRMDVTQNDDGHPHLEWSEQTEEGFRVMVAWLCEAEDCNRDMTQRDHSAEAAGY